MNHRQRVGLLAAMLWGLSPVALHAATAILDWDANTESDLAGYRLYQSAAPLLAKTTTQAAADSSIIKTSLGITTSHSLNLNTNTTYYFALTARDNAGNESVFNVDAGGARIEIVVFLAPNNNPPTVNAGPDGNVVQGSSLSLDGTVSDDGFPSGTLTTTWSKVSGPGTATFGNANNVDTTVSFSASGSYVLRLTASDGSLATSDDANVTVTAPVTPPTVSLTAPDAAAAEAGPDNGQFRITRTGATTSALTVTFTVGGSATPGADYGSVGTSAQIPSGASFVNIALTPVNDTDVEIDETVSLTLANPGTYVIDGANSAATVTITDNDAPPTGALPAPWVNTDVGSVGVAGAAGFNSGVFTVQGGGADIWDSVDGFHFVHRTLSGNGEIMARVISMDNTDVWAKAGVMIRESLNANAKNAMMTVTSAFGLAFQFRTNTGQGTVNPGRETGTAAPIWLKLSRQGSTLTASRSSDGTAWTVLGSTSISMANNVFVGLAVTAHNNTMLNNARFEQVNFTQTVTNQAPLVNAGADQVVTLPASASLAGTVSDDGLPGGSVTTTWSLVSGPGSVTFGNASALNTTANFSATGVYVLRLNADDGALSSNDTVSINVGAAPPVNQAPTADAGLNQTVTLPGLASLDGDATDDGLPAGTLTTTWTKTSGPGTVTFTNPNALFTTVGFSAAGSYVLTLTATDGTLSTSDTVSVTVNPAPPPNQAPTVNAGTDQTVTFPSSASLDSTVTDDGLPNGLITATWIKVSGPGTVTFGNANLFDTTASFSAVGTYVLRLTASDSVLSTSDEITVTVTNAPPVNQAPVTLAGPDQAVTFPSAVTLNGTVTDDGLPGANVNGAWSKVSGPGSVSFGNAALIDTTATFSSTGTYVLRLTGSDSVLSSMDEVTVSVNLAPISNVAPLVSAGPDRVITIPASALLDGNISDDGLPNGSVLATWSQVSGPSGANISSINAIDTVVGFSVPGSYVFQLTGDDGNLTGTDSVTVTVNGQTPTLPTVTLSAMDASMAEPMDSGLIRIARTGSTSNTLVVNLSVGGTAIAGVDYIQVPAQIAIPLGQSQVDLPITPFDDGLQESVETIVVQLLAGSSYNIGTVGSASLGIVDNDGLGNDVSAPLISGLAATPSRSDAVIGWDTDERATGRVEYGTTSAMGQATPFSTNGVLSHSATLTVLGSGTLYYYQVRAIDAVGNESVSGIRTFQTLGRAALQFYADPATVAAALGSNEVLAGQSLAVQTLVSDGTGGLGASATTIVRLHYSVANGPFQVMNLSNTGGGDLFTAVVAALPIQANPVQIRYFGELQDGADHVFTASTKTITLSPSMRVAGVQRGGRLHFEVPDSNPLDGQMSISMAPDAKVSEVLVKVLATVPAPRKVGAVYELSLPDKKHTLFGKPVTVTLVYNDSEGGIGNGQTDGTQIPETNLRAYWLDNGEWRLLGGEVDPVKNTVTFKTNHFSVFALMPVGNEQTAKTEHRFLSPAHVDGINDVATFGMDAEEVTILDVNGQIVFQTTLQEMGGSAISWHGHNEAGLIVPSGPYVVKIKTADGKALYQTLAVVK